MGVLSDMFNWYSIKLGGETSTVTPIFGQQQKKEKKHLTKRLNDKINQFKMIPPSLQDFDAYVMNNFKKQYLY